MKRPFIGTLLFVFICACWTVGSVAAQQRESDPLQEAIARLEASLAQLRSTTKPSPATPAAPASAGRDEARLQTASAEELEEISSSIEALSTSHQALSELVMQLSARLAAGDTLAEGQTAALMDQLSALIAASRSEGAAPVPEEAPATPEAAPMTPEEAARLEAERLDNLREDLNVLGFRARIAGGFFGDYYAMAANHDTDLRGQNAFWIRLLWLQTDFVLAENWSMRIRADMSSPGDFTSASRLSPSLKDAHIRWQAGRHQVAFGVTGTPTWATLEKVWGYRPVEKTLLDLQRMGQLRDFGVNVSGSFDADRLVRYNVMVANGSGLSAETNKGKVFMGAIGLFPDDNLVFEVYGDYNILDDLNQYTLQAFLGYNDKPFRGGLQVAHQTRNFDDGSSLTLLGTSAFGALAFSPTVTGFLRYDRMFNPNPGGDGIAYLPFNPNARSNLVIVGTEIKPMPFLSIMPNAEFIFYDATDGVAPSADAMLRLTFWFRI